MSDFQTWAQSIDPKVWSKNDLHYSKLAWDEGRKELEARIERKDIKLAEYVRIIVGYEEETQKWNDVMQVLKHQITKLTDRIDEAEAEVQELRHKSISDHATIVVLESFIASIDPDLLDPKEEVFWEELHKKYYPEHYGR